MSRFWALARILRRQPLYILIAGIAAAIFWAVGQPTNPYTVVVYALCIGNLIHTPFRRLNRHVSKRPFPYNWLLSLVILIALTMPVYLVSSVVVWWIAPPAPQSLERWIGQWKFPVLTTFVFGTALLLFDATKERLERRNAELQRSVELGAARLELQDQDLGRAREIQLSLLPKEIPQIPGFEVATAWRPARMVSGDYFDVLRLGEKRLAICIADVVEKGVAAALLMAGVQATLRAFARDEASPARVCRRMNAVLDAESRMLSYCNAGHPFPLLVSSGSVRPLEEGGAVLGVFPDWNYEDSTIGLRPGDRLLLFTDGITEASGPHDQEFGQENIAEVAGANSASSADELNRRLLSRVAEFCGGQFHDDATLLVIAATD